MLENHIRDSIASVQALLAMTHQDLEDIKQAKHEAVFSRIKSKEALINSFYEQKEQAKQIILRLSEENPEAEVRELIGAEAVSLFDELNTSLIELKEQNLNFAKISIAVGEFYRSMLDNFLPSEFNYDGRKTSPEVQFIALDA